MRRQDFDLTCTTASFDFLSDHCLCRGMAFGFDLSPNAREGVVEAIADGTVVIWLLEVDRNSQVALLNLKFPSIVDDGTITAAAKFVFLGTKFDSFYLGLCHGAHGGERYRLAFLAAAGAGERIFLVYFTENSSPIP
jgi:hypothetical protein